MVGKRERCRVSFFQTMRKEGKGRCLDVLLLPRTVVTNVTCFAARPT